MPLGTEVGLGPGNIVLDGDPARSPPGKGVQQPPPRLFGPCLLWPNGTVAHFSNCSALVEICLIQLYTQYLQFFCL